MLNWPVQVGLFVLRASTPGPTLVMSDGPANEPVAVARMPVSTPTAVGVLNVTAPVRVLFPATFSTAPLPPTPVPLRNSGRARLNPAALWSWTAEPVPATTTADDDPSELACWALTT